MRKVWPLKFLALQVRVLLGFVLIAGAVSAQDPPKKHRWLGKHWPSLSVKNDHWVNRRKPLRASDLRGKVLWVQFGFLK